MMICPKTFFELELKGKSPEEIKTVIRSLKRRINHLKTVLEHPDYTHTICPSEDVQLSCNREYLEEAIVALEGKVLSTDKMGRKKLSYDIKDFRDGYMVVHTFELEPNQVEKFNRQLRLNENILRIMLLEVSAVKA